MVESDGALSGNERVNRALQEVAIPPDARSIWAANYRLDGIGSEEQERGDGMHDERNEAGGVYGQLLRAITVEQCPSWYFYIYPTVRKGASVLASEAR